MVQLKQQYQQQYQAQQKQLDLEKRLLDQQVAAKNYAQPIENYGDVNNFKRDFEQHTAYKRPQQQQQQQHQHQQEQHLAVAKQHGGLNFANQAQSRSANGFANGGNQNCGNSIEGCRPTSKVLKPPGGGSSFGSGLSFG